MYAIDMSADELVSALLNLASSESVCILDSCGVGHLGSHLLIAGIEPVEVLEISNTAPDETLAILDNKLSGELASIFTISYDFGIKLLGIESAIRPSASQPEPAVFLSQFDVLIIHDYDTGKTNLAGNTAKFEAIFDKLKRHTSDLKFEISNSSLSAISNFTKSEYLAAIENLKERIRCGDTYQTNLTQQLTAQLPAGLTPEIIFARLRRDHPAPFAAFLKRLDSTVVSASPERFIKIGGNAAGRECADALTISTSPIKGTRRRGETAAEDETLKTALITSQKDRAENTMIVDLLRNDLGRICKFGSVRVEKLCELEEHPTLFHLVSTIGGDLRKGTAFSEILKAVFPCGSITGAPKISTMRIIDEIETADRGLSMGSIGYHIPEGRFGLPEKLDLSVAIRTMVIRDGTAIFNVGGGIVIDSDPESEYDETLTKAKALLAAVAARFEFQL